MADYGPRNASIVMEIRDIPKSIKTQDLELNIKMIVAAYLTSLPNIGAMTLHVKRLQRTVK